MIVWLASYPRSGNTLLRMLINRSFGVSTYSLYDDSFDVGSTEAFTRIVGQRTHGMAAEAFRVIARESPLRFLIKTHELPDDREKAIYVVRDGRASVVSYTHYRRQLANEDVSFAQVIRGEVWGGGWGAHVRAWALTPRENTLVLRYEEIVADAPTQVARITAFLGVDTPQAAELEFSELHQAFPAFFRSGSNAKNIAELQGDDLDLFWNLHGATMRELGYSG